MLCDTCHGSGMIPQRPAPDQPPRLVPCPDCGGTGVGHCCDGLAEQPGDEERGRNLMEQSEMQDRGRNK